MKSMKPSGRPVDDESKAFHHVTGFLARPLEVKMEAGKGVTTAWKAIAAGKKASSLQISHSFNCLNLLRGQPGTQVLGVKHVGNQVAGLDDEVKPLLDFAAVILQDWLIEKVHEYVAGISNGVMSLCPRSKAVVTGRSMLAKSLTCWNMFMSMIF